LPVPRGLSQANTAAKSIGRVASRHHVPPTWLKAESADLHPSEGHESSGSQSNPGDRENAEQVSTGEVVVLRKAIGAIEFEALSDAGSSPGGGQAPPYDCDGHYSVHNNAGRLGIWGGNHRRYRPLVPQPGCLAPARLWDGEICLARAQLMRKRCWVQRISFRRAVGAGSAGTSDRVYLRSEHFPGQARGARCQPSREFIIASSDDPAMSGGDSSALNKIRLERPGGSMAL